MSEHPKWNGLIQSIRFDPVAYLASQPRETERTMCRFEFVRFTEEAPLYDSRSDYGKAQGICGWHYETVNDAEDTVLFGWDQENKIWRRGTQECGITIDKQYSNGKTEAIRKWTAPVAGKYTVAYSGSPLDLSENIITIGGDRFVKTLHEPFNGELTLELDKGDEICLKTLYGSCNNIHIVIQKNDS